MRRAACLSRTSSGSTLKSLMWPSVRPWQFAEPDRRRFGSLGFEYLVSLDLVVNGLGFGAVMTMRAIVVSWPKLRR